MTKIVENSRKHGKSRESSHTFCRFSSSVDNIENYTRNPKQTFKIRFDEENGEKFSKNCENFSEISVLGALILVYFDRFSTDMKRRFNSIPGGVALQSTGKSENFEPRKRI